MAKKNGSEAGGAAKVGLGLAAVAAAAAGAYFFYGPNGSKNRKDMKSWAVKAKGEVMENVEKLKDVSEKSYAETVKKVLAKYKKARSAAPKELAMVEKELKSSWNSIKAEMLKSAKSAK